VGVNVSKNLQPSAFEVEETYPMSPLQQGMLYHSLRAPGSGVDIEQLVCELHEVLEVTALQRSWQCVIARHPALRTNFRWQGLKEPQQEVHSVVELPWKEQDWRDLPPDEKEKRSATFLMADRRRGFDLTQSPLLRLTLFHWDDAHSRLIWTFHHALLDGRSFAPLLREVFTFYEAFKRGEEMKLPLPRPYRDYIDWLQQQDFSKAEPFWRQTLKDFSAPTPLVVDHVPSTGGDDGTRQGDQEIWLSTEITTTLRSLARENQLTLNTVVQGAWALLLNRYSGEADVVFGATRACRRSSVEGAEAMVGLFINTLPLRVRVNPEAPLLPWLKELRVQWMAMREYEHTPLVKIPGWSGVPAGSSLFESIVVFENFHLDTLLRTQGGSWSNRRFRLFEKTNYPITLAVYAEAELCLKIGFDRSRFDDATIGRMLGHLRTLLEAMAEQPQRRLGDYQLLTPAERHQMLVEWNATRADYPEDKCIHELFEAQVERTPEAVAVVFEDRRLTYAELNRRANQLAHRLRKMGVQPDTLVGICVERSLEMVVGILGILKAGGAYLPLDPAYPKERLAFMLDDARPKVVLTQQRLINSLPKNGAKSMALDSESETFITESPENPDSSVWLDHLAYVIYTSGSTGKPKGVMIPHAAVVNFLHFMQQQLELGPQDVLLAVTTLSFDIAGLEIFLPLSVGAQVALVSREVASDGVLLSAELKRTSTTVMQATPATWRLLLEAGWEGGPHLKILCGGEAWSAELANELLMRCGSLWNMYGPTETTIWSTAHKVADAAKPVAIGRPIANTTIYLLDKNLNPVPIGVPGELHIGGAGLARGYHNRPELTAEKFIPDPFSTEPGARLYRTGDLARYLPGGDIEYLGRMDHQVKIRGFRIELGEIEAVLGQCSSVGVCVVVVREDVPGDKRLVAYLTAKAGEPPNVSELRSLLQTKLPEYMVPSAFVTLDRFPLTPSGKLDRKALPMPDLARPELEKAFVAPRTPIERVLAGIWCEVLGLKQVGVHDNFFDLGGHSLLAVRSQARVEKQLGKRLPLAAFFQSPTVGELAALLTDGSTPAQGLHVFAPQSSGDKPPLFCLHFLSSTQSLAKHLGPNRPVYGIASPFDEELRLWHERGHAGICVEDLAARCLPILRGVQPGGPYYLAGFCFGGVLAFEIACQLKLQGEEVALLALLDAMYAPGCKPFTIPWIKRWTYHARQASTRGPAYLLTKLRKKLQLAKRRRSKLVQMGDRSRLPDERRTKEPELPQAEFLSQLLKAYKGKPYAGDTVLFRTVAEPNSFAFDLGTTNGWDQVVLGELQVEEIHCNHMNISEEPYVREVARKLENYLSRSDAKATTMVQADQNLR
jgi:amino acid adenylation domain-containing protein